MNRQTIGKFLIAVSLVLAAYSVGGMKGCEFEWPVIVPPVVVVPEKPTAVTYVYEKDETAVPSAVRAALSALNKQGILATEFEDDAVDGTGETPEQYQIPLKAAREAGLPALVATNGAKVIRTVKNPKTEAEVLEAAK